MATGSQTRPWRLVGLLAAGTACIGFSPASAQDADELEPASRAVVQPLPARGSLQLNAALNRLAANPRDVAALLDAGNAALSLGDTEAALGFYGRADQLAPGDPRIKSALATAMVRNEDPFAAIPLFAAAERAGARDPLLAGERGLAYDLVGDNAEAQRFYRQALAAAPGNDEIARRLALSLAIAGDRKSSEAALLAQIRRNDRAGWRTRAFALAILGDTEEAVKIANGTMPRDLAAAMVPYLRYMGRLTPAQQAAAANFGHFPRAAQIGRDDPRVAQYAALNPRKPIAPAAAAKAEPAKKGRGKNGSRRSERDPPRVAVATVRRPPVSTPTPAPTPVQRVAPLPVRVAAATPTPIAAAPLQTPNAPAPASTTGEPTPTGPTIAGMPASLGPSTTLAAAPAPASVAQPGGPVSNPVSSPAVALPTVSSPVASYALPPSNLDLARQTQQAAAAPSAELPTAPAPQPDFAAAFGDFRPPADEQRLTVPVVDLAALERGRAQRTAAADERGPLPDAPKDTRRVTTSDPAATSDKRRGTDAKSAKTAKADKPKPKPAAPSHPSRIWVQIGVGRDKGALAFDWRKHQRTDAELFKAKKAWTTPWGQTNRLLVGPFESQAAAQAFLKSLRKEEVDAFVWTSPAGQAVDALAAK